MEVSHLLSPHIDVVLSQEGVKFGKLALIPALKLFNAPLLSADATSPQLLSHEPAFLVNYRKHIFMALHLVYEVHSVHMYTCTWQIAYLTRK